MSYETDLITRFFSLYQTLEKLMEPNTPHQTPLTRGDFNSFPDLQDDVNFLNSNEGKLLRQKFQTHFRVTWIGVKNFRDGMTQTSTKKLFGPWATTYSFSTGDITMSTDSVTIALRALHKAAVKRPAATTHT